MELDDSGQYRMLHTVRQFCVEHSATRDVLDRAEEAHARYFADWCDDVGAGRMGLERRPFLRRMPDVVAAMTWARAHDREAAFRMCRGLAPVRSTLGQRGDVIATWWWLMSLDAGDRGPLWAEAVAGLLPVATLQGLDTEPAAAAVQAELTDEAGRAASWLRRGRAMVPAYGGQVAAIRAYAEGLLVRGDDLEASVYAGLAAYMLSLMGRLIECDSLLERLRRMTRRHDTVFSVDSVGNAYAATIVSATLRGDLGAAVERGRRPVPIDPAFSVTSAGALAHAALLTADADAMRRALEWSSLGSTPLLEYMTPFTAACAALLDSRVTEAADLAEEFWEQAAPVPVWQVFAVPIVVAALLRAGRCDVGEQVARRAEALLADMEEAAAPHRRGAPRQGAAGPGP